MSNFEIIKECKMAYEILLDLKENSGALSNERINVNKMMELLGDLYNSAWEILANDTETSKQLITSNKDRFGHQLLISDLIDYAYLCKECDENQYVTECDVDEVAGWLK